MASELETSEAELREQLASAKSKLLAARLKRVPPLLDDKVVCAWNGLMIGAMAEGARVLRDARYLASAERAADFVLDRMMRPDGGLYRTARGGKAHLDAYLEDYAYLGDGLLDLYEAGGAPQRLADVTKLCDRMLADFGDPEGGAFFFTAHDHEKLLARPREGHDGALPSPNAVAARLLARASVHLDRVELRARAAAALTAHGQLVERSPRSFATALSVLDFLLEPPVELCVVGSEDQREPLAAELARHFVPNRVVAWVDPGDDRAAVSPLTRGKTMIDDRATLYVCRDGACRAPLTDLSAVAGALGEQAKETRSARASGIGIRKLAGHATGEGTRACAEKHGESWDARAYTALGATGLMVSRLGLGGYRLDAHTPEHRAALALALERGINLLDTSTNYTDGESERVMGEVIRDLEQSGKLWRDQLVVVSKIGYVQGKNLDLASERERAGRAYPEMVKVGPGISHCLHPEWIEDQLTRSLDRLGLETLDVCLLHNPEYFLSDAAKRGERSRRRAARRVLSARRGGVRALRAGAEPRPDPGLRRLEQHLGEFARRPRRHRPRSNARGCEACGRRRSRLCRRAGALQLVRARRPARGRSARDRAAGAARGAGESPTQRVLGRGLVRLADVPTLAGAAPVETALARVAELEKEFRETFASKLRTGPGSPPPEALLNWAEQLGRLPANAQSFAEWSSIEREVVLPRTHHVIATLDRTLRGELEQRWKDWSARYVTSLEALLLSIGQRSADASRALASRLHGELDPRLPAERRSASLSQKALWSIGSVPGVTSVLDRDAAPGVRQRRLRSPVVASPAPGATGHRSRRGLSEFSPPGRRIGPKVVLRVLESRERALYARPVEPIYYAAPAAGVLALVFAFWKASWITRQDAGTREMQDIAQLIREGAMAFLAREYKVLAVFVIAVAGLLAVVNSQGRAGQTPLVAAAFVVGAVASGLSGYFGMRVATAANVRTTAAARTGLASALAVAFNGGSVMGMTVVGLALLGLGRLVHRLLATPVPGSEQLDDGHQRAHRLLDGRVEHRALRPRGRRHLHQGRRRRRRPRRQGRGRACPKTTRAIRR